MKTARGTHSVCFWGDASVESLGNRGLCHQPERPWRGCGFILLFSWYWFQVTRSGFCPKDGPQVQLVGTALVLVVGVAGVCGFKSVRGPVPGPAPPKMKSPLKSPDDTYETT